MKKKKTFSHDLRRKNTGYCSEAGPPKFSFEVFFMDKTSKNVIEIHNRLTSTSFSIGLFNMMARRLNSFGDHLMKR